MNSAPWHYVGAVMSKFVAFLKLANKSGANIAPGKATAKGHEGWIELSSVSLGPQRHPTGSLSPTGVTAPRHLPGPNEIHVTKALDGASSQLFLFGSTGQTLDQAIIEFVDATANPPKVYLTYTMKDVIVSSR